MKWSRRIHGELGHSIAMGWPISITRIEYFPLHLMHIDSMLYGLAWLQLAQVIVGCIALNAEVDESLVQPRAARGLGRSLELMVLIVAFNAINLTEAFGNGPPYYGRTTNMDKWSNPLPVLVGVDTLGVLAIAAYVYLLRRKR